MRYFIQTLGCQMNYSDSERVSHILESLGYRLASKTADADLLIYNTCSIRQKAEDKVTGHVKDWTQLKKHNPSLLIGLTGCMVRKTSTQQSNEKDELLKKFRGIDFVFRIEDLSSLAKILREANDGLSLQEFDIGSLKSYFDIHPKYSSHFQAYVPVMTGCDNFCTFCIVPFTRGRERSRSIEEIVSEVQNLVDNGCVEVTFIGQKVNGYGLSLLDQKCNYFSKIHGHPFARLLSEIHNIHGLKRIRFTSSHPDNMTDDLIETIGRLKKVSPYIHLPIQSGDNEILKRMNRRYTRERYIEIVQKFRSVMPQMSLSTDIIVGFCGETQKQFQNTYLLFEELRFDMAYISQYSPRRGTVSARFYQDDVPQKEKKRRFHLLNNLLKQIATENHRQYVGRTVEVLVEKCEERICSGRSEAFRIVEFPGSPELVGEIVPVRITASREWMLKGEPVFQKLYQNEIILHTTLPVHI